MDVTKLIKLHQALHDADAEIDALGGELRRLDEREMVPVQVRSNPRVREGLAVALAVVEEMLKGIQAPEVKS